MLLLLLLPLGSGINRVPPLAFAQWGGEERVFCKGASRNQVVLQRAIAHH